VSSYFIGNNPAQWHAGIRNFGRLRYHDVWPGIDVVYYGTGNRLEYDFVVAPGADPRAIGIRFTSPEALRVDTNGDVVLGGDIRQHKPRVYQNTPAGRREVAGDYVLESGNRVRFRLGRYDHSRPLVIDPVLAYATLFGGQSSDFGDGIAVDSSGSVYIIGSTFSADLPATAGGTTLQGSAPSDVYVAKLKPDGSGVVYCTYLGGEDVDGGSAIAVDASGNAYITGFTASLKFPTTPGVVQPATRGGKSDAFVAKLNPQGTALLFSTYLGGTSEDAGRSLALDASGNVYVTGITNSANFPVSTPGTPFQARSKGGAYDGFVTKLNSSGTSIVYSTYLGSGGDDEPFGIAVNSGGEAYVVGTTDGTDFPTVSAFLSTAPNPVITGFAVRLNAGGSALIYGTYLGGSVGEGCNGVAVDTAGNAYIVGMTFSTNFPKTNGSFKTSYSGMGDGFVVKLNPAGNSLVYGTFLGGTDIDTAEGIAIDPAGNAYVTGYTSSTDFPMAGGPFQSALRGGYDAFVAKLNPAGTTLSYSSYMGGTKDEKAWNIAVDSRGTAYVIGTTASSDFKTTPGVLRSAGVAEEAFVLKVQDTPLPTLVVDNPALNFTYPLGTAAPGPQTVQVTSSGVPIAFTAAATGATWLAVGPGSASTPASLSAFVNTAGLAAGTFNGSIVITASGAANSPVNIPVKLTVTQGAPAPTFTAVLPATIPAGSPDTTITVTGTNFVSGSTVQVNGQAVATTFVNATTLTAVIPAARLANPGTLSITVANPAPNAATTGSVTITVTAARPAVTEIVNGASLAAGPVAAGEMVRIRGTQMGPVDVVKATGAGGSNETVLGDTRVLFGDVAAALVSASATEIVAIVPFEVDGLPTVAIVVEAAGVKSDPVSRDVAAAAPALFTADGSGVGQAQATNEDSSANGKDNPAAVGSVVTFSATGGGQTNPAGVDGLILGDDMPQLLQAVAVQIGGVDCEVVKAGPAAGEVSGMLRISVHVPEGVSGTTPVTLTIGGISSQPGVTLEVQ
jgi:uncharacterized protein (TIGR03437 family)